MKASHVLVRVLAAASVSAMGLACWSSGAGAQTAVPTTFNGSCSIVGSTAVVGAGDVFTGAGTCTGSINGGPTVTEAVTNTVTESGLSTPAGYGAPSLPLLLSGTGNVVFTGLCNKKMACDTVDFSLIQLGTILVISGTGGGYALGLAVPNPSTGTDQIEVTTLGTTLGKTLITL
jgi:hypothetical protein